MLITHRQFPKLLLLSGLTIAILTTSQSLSASEKDELASTLNLIQQVQHSLERARSASAQTDSDQTRYYFDYLSASDDLNVIKLGIGNYLEPARAQPLDGHLLSGQYRKDAF
jgi:RAQPRD family integrative conjugative element protein